MPIINRKSCSLTEINALKTYLSQTPVSCMVERINRGAEVSKGEVTPISEIGGLRTIWSDLGTIRSIDEHGSDKFLVSQVAKALSKPSCTDRRTLEEIRQYIQLLDSGRLELKITLVEDKNGLLICDGNKRAVACYEWGLREDLQRFMLPVYVVTLR